VDSSAQNVAKRTSCPDSPMVRGVHKIMCRRQRL
jgi:hypothetical protein